MNIDQKAELDGSVEQCTGRLRHNDATLTFDILTPKPNHVMFVQRRTNG